MFQSNAIMLHLHRKIETIKSALHQNLLIYLRLESALLICAYIRIM